MTLIAHPISTPKLVADQSPAQSTTQSPPVLNVRTTVIWRSSSAQVKNQLNATLSQVEAGKSVSRSPEYSNLAMEALLASRNRKIASKKLAKKLAKDLAQGID